MRKIVLIVWVIIMATLILAGCESNKSNIEKDIERQIRGSVPIGAERKVGLGFKVVEEGKLDIIRKESRQWRGDTQHLRVGLMSFKFKNKKRGDVFDGEALFVADYRESEGKLNLGGCKVLVVLNKSDPKFSNQRKYLIEGMKKAKAWDS